MRKQLGVMLSVVALVVFWADHDVFAQPYRHPATGVLFPEQVATLDRGTIREFEKEHPGLGTGIGYDAPGITVTLYLYTGRMPTVPSDLTSPILRRHFGEVVGDVIRAGETSQYTNVKKLAEGEALWRTAPKETQSLSATFSYVQNGTERISYLYLRGCQKHFLKVRFTYDKDVQARAEEVRKQFLEALARMTDG